MFYYTAEVVMSDGRAIISVQQKTILPGSLENFESDFKTSAAH